MTIIRGVARGGAGPPPGIWSIILPFSNQGGRLCPSILPTPRNQEAIYASDNEVSFQYEPTEKPLFQWNEVLKRRIYNKRSLVIQKQLIS